MSKVPLRPCDNHDAAGAFIGGEHDQMKLAHDGKKCQLLSSSPLIYADNTWVVHASDRAAENGASNSGNSPQECQIIKYTMSVINYAFSFCLHLVTLPSHRQEPSSTWCGVTPHIFKPLVKKPKFSYMSVSSHST
nr:hypothetical protein CFP56_31820 [Quercus suber]